MDSTRKFSGKAEGYAKYRPCYPEEYLDYLIDSNALVSGCAVADIGSGTGILSGQLLGRGLAVMAVEPNADMRGSAERHLCSYSAFRSVNGTAENTGLESESVDLVTAAQAFHWFDRERFKAECRRILKPGAKVALVWNSRVRESTLVMETEELCVRLCPDYVGFSGGIAHNRDAFTLFFRGGQFEYRVFPNDESYRDLEGFIGRNLSASYAPQAGDENYTEFIVGLTRLFDKYSAEGALTLPSETHSYMGFV